MSSNPDNLKDELNELRAKYNKLKETSDAIAVANAHAGQLLAELEESREREQELLRRGEELDLQNRIDRVLILYSDEKQLLLQFIEQLEITDSLGIKSCRIYIPESPSDLNKEMQAADSLSPALLDPPTSAPGNHLKIPIPIHGDVEGSIDLELFQTDEIWCDRWIRMLWSVGTQLGSTILRLRVQAENDRINGELIEARDQALEAIRTRTAFLANMSHELRTPLNAILGYSDLLIEDSKSSTPESIEQDAQKIQFAGKHLLELIDDILDMSKIESGKTPVYLETFDIVQLVNEVVGAMEPIAAKNKNTIITLFEKNLDFMHSDSTKIRQCLLNLISNACKFSSNSQIDVHVEPVTREDQQWIRFSVKDRGIGISESQLSRLFLPFVQADDSTTRKYGGTGLGLAITKSYCQLLGGDISVDSAMGSGSSFIIELPRSVSEEKLSILKVPVVSSPPKPLVSSSVKPILDSLKTGDAGNRSGTILVIDDNADTLELIHRHFTKFGYHVTQATNGEAGMILVKSQRPDLIILDVMMPQINGWQILAMLKADPAMSSIPVVLLTVMENKPIGMALGASECLSKPIRWDLLESTVIQLIDEQQSKYILVVEDDPDSSDIISRTLRRNGWQVQNASNGKQALMTVKKAVPSVVILDLMMPEMDGFACLHYLRSSPNTRTLPVIILSNKILTPEDRQQLEGPAVKLLPKTNSQRSELVDLVRGIIESR